MNRSIVSALGYPDADKQGSLSSEEVQVLCQQVKAGSKDAVEALVLGHLWLAKQIARRYGRDWQEYLDLVQVGCLSLLEAVATYAFEGRDYPFGVFAFYELRRKMYLTKINASYIICLPYHLARLRGRMIRLRLDQGDNAPSDVETLARECNASVGEVKTVLNYDNFINPLRIESFTGQDGEVLDVVRDARPTPDDAVERVFAINRLYEMINGLPPKQQAVLKLRFGLGGGQYHKLKEAAAILGKADYWARKEQASAFQTLKTRFPKELLILLQILAAK